MTYTPEPTRATAIHRLRTANSPVVGPVSSPSTPATEVLGLRAGYLLPYSSGTRELYAYHLDRYLRWCESIGLDPLAARSSHVELFIHHLRVECGLRPSSVCTNLTPVRGFYRYACNENAIDRDPSFHARRPRYNYLQDNTVGLDRDQMRAFLRAGEDMGGRYHATAYILGCMALRASEACSLRIEDCQRTVRGHRVLEFTGKGSAPARMPIPVLVLRAIDAAASGRAAGPLITRRDDDRALTRQGLNTIVNTVAKRAGVSERITSHVLRHSAITNALESGASLRKVMDLARHTEPRTTMRYDRNRTSLDDHAVHALAAFLA